MKLHLLCIGRRMPDWIAAGYRDYARRLPLECALNLIEIEPVQRSRNLPADQVRAEEGRRLLKAVPKGAELIALDEHGQTLSTRALAERMRAWLADGRDRAFLVGGAEGLAADCLNQANAVWSLSALTFPHQLVRVILAEQFYRAWSLMKGHPYHRD
ncbi:23S rRNA (pseudouridine(1915)-N(3))-methyltransferase RlmH [Caldichromatium japonicum]|uniref:Ribosomal RNA large subunit methyltransferase H n=1 Tax=Caldichromatium japonicum TaxID=2699430 RepID=A0A6G7VFJ0_9GAMM|nr:23S rRNA (pseudouridine(1915)-N(3))-methyltransferase RlmH [Caldichromatium japonicum]QIK38670.1 23S rRNA (pseudouridine(1915)-N(3))-methyltransferase RlmH [Caldichromatium japonicum]